ncbi:hypothetical protein Glove_261g3 [Diversispora epigaea]|uniref:Uncharacterized protein n=1 Tax=Diversispora epigaea TaxID=1348612 RepID=A0A397IEM8_9GLOM|nr:hypothetical protein Glove_261g3 [Diversispora epigaea]
MSNNEIPNNSFDSKNLNIIIGKIRATWECCGNVIRIYWDALIKDYKRVSDDEHNYIYDLEHESDNHHEGSSSGPHPRRRCVRDSSYHPCVKKIHHRNESTIPADDYHDNDHDHEDYDNDHDHEQDYDNDHDHEELISSAEQTETNQINTSNTPTQTSRCFSHKQNMLQGFIEELFTSINEELVESNDNNDVEEGSIPLVQLFQKACRAEMRMINANHEEILCWYHYGKKYMSQVNDTMDFQECGKNIARKDVYKEIMNHLPGFNRNTVRNKTQDNQIDSFSDENFVIEFDKEGYLCALNSIKDDETSVSDIESDIEPDKSTPCVLIDYIDGIYKTRAQTNCAKRLRELTGTWQIDNEMVTQANNDLSKLGVCIGIGCMEHSSIMLERVIIGQINCQALKENGGHLYIKPGKGHKPIGCEKYHTTDTSKQLEIIGRWLTRIAKFGENEFQNKTLMTIAPSIFQVLKEIRSTNCTSQVTKSELGLEGSYNVPSLLMLHVGMQLKRISTEILMPEDLEDQFCQNLGKNFAYKLWKSQTELVFLHVVANQRQNKRNKPIKLHNSIQITKIISLFLSILINTTFPSLQNWFSIVIASLIRKPKMGSDLTKLLATLKILAHCGDHERKLEKKRMNEVNPTKRLNQNPCLWNLAVIDNIDFKEKTFSYGNIFDITRGTSHATLRMAFQIPLSSQIIESKNDEKVLTSDCIFGMNDIAQKKLDLYDEIFNECLAFYYSNDKKLQYETKFDVLTVRKKIIKRLDRGCFGDSHDIVILEAGGTPNTNEGIYDAAKMYKIDFALDLNKYLDIVADESIFRRLINLRQEWPNLRPILGSWHTSKDMASAFVTIFSSYGIFDLAAAIGVKFLDKLEKVVDYRATVRIIELIWASVGITLQIHLKSKNLNKNNIWDEKYEEFKILKIWYSFYNWAGLFLAHRIDIRIGNFDIQKNNLSPYFLQLENQIILIVIELFL